MRTCTVVSVMLVSVMAIAGAVVADDAGMFHSSSMAQAATGPHTPGTKAEFAFLAVQTRNSCGLQPATVMSYPATERIQGSCCTAMEWDHYQQQVRDLRAYHALTIIPGDPYDVSAALTKKLFAYADSIHLTGAQQRVYNRAMSITPEKGPCCCNCWRWHAFAGLSKYLIVHENFSAQEVARVIHLVDGCGG